MLNLWIRAESVDCMHFIGESILWRGIQAEYARDL